MRNSIKICLILLGLLQFSEVLAQGKSWTQDSLSFYEKQFWAQIKSKNSAEADKTITYITEKGSEELDPKVFDFFISTLNKSSEIPYPVVLGNVASGLGTLEYYRGNIVASKEAFKKAKRSYSAAKMLNETAGMAMNIGVMQEKGGHYDSAILNYKEAYPIFEEQKDIPSLASVNENIGLAYMKMNDYPKSLEYLELTDSLLSTYLDSMEVRWIGFYINKQITLIGLRREAEALALLFKALKIAEHNQDPQYIGKVHYKLADIYDFMGDTPKQYKSLMTARSAYKDTQNLLDLANIHTSLIMYHFDSGSLDSAIVYAQKCLEFYEPNGFVDEVGITYGMLGNVEFKKENYSEAIRYFQKALENFGDQNSQSYAGYLFNIGFAYNKIGNSKAALEYIERSLVTRKKLNIAVDLMESYQGLAETYQRIGDYKKAFENLTLYQLYKDSVFTETKNKQLTELQEQFESDKKDKAIAELEQERELQNLRTQKQQAQIYFSIGGLVFLLGISGVFFRQATVRKKHNQQLEAKNLEIAKQNAERELLLKEIHHRVKNNLQIISSLLSMQTRSMKDEKMKDAMKESQSRVKTMALIHEKLYQYENLSKINMQEYMQQLSEFLTHTYRSDKDIKITIDAANINLDMDMAIPLGLITNELLSNALKYAFEDREYGEITIRFSQKEPGSYTLLVKDTGIGLDKNLDIENTKSLGLKLVKTHEFLTYACSEASARSACREPFKRLLNSFSFLKDEFLSFHFNATLTRIQFTVQNSDRISSRFPLHSLCVAFDTNL
ncbi:MAG: tetratricopeptide repeat protein [Algoriphagus sp.]|nr:tetratricopeptide repeat protein [Algoriphagus sp.]